MKATQKVASNFEGYVRFDSDKEREEIRLQIEIGIGWVKKADDIINSFYCNFLEEKSEETMIEKVVAGNENEKIEFDSQFDFSAFKIGEIVKEKDEKQISEKISKLRQVSLVACDNAHQIQNLSYLNYSEKDSLVIQKIDNCAGQIENQARQINQSLHRIQYFPNEMNSNQLSNQAKSKAHSINELVKQVESLMTQLSSQSLRDSLVPFKNQLFIFSNFYQ